MSLRSEIGTRWHFFVHIDAERAIHTWKTVYGFTRNSLLILTFFCVIGALIPQYAPGGDPQADRIEAQQDEMRVRIDQQEVHGAVVDQKFQAITDRLAGIEHWQESMTDRLNIVLAGLLLFLLKQIFERVFAGKIASRRESPGNPQGP